MYYYRNHGTYHPEKAEHLTQHSNVGVPIADMQAILLDDYQRLVPLGVPGELHVAGAGSSWLFASTSPNGSAPDANPKHAESKNSEQRMYKSGDLMRRLPNSELVYLGRNDLQVKIRGYRIEPGEIESCLCELAAIEQATVIDLENDGNKFLCACWSRKTLSLAKAGDHTTETVSSSYMVPTAFVEVDHIPLTLNGKLDKAAACSTIRHQRKF